MWIGTGDIILVGLRDYQDTKADVILKYNPDEARNLKSYGELPDNGSCKHRGRACSLSFVAKINESSFGPGGQDEDIVFDDDFSDDDVDDV